MGGTETVGSAAHHYAGALIPIENGAVTGARKASAIARSPALAVPRGVNTYASDKVQENACYAHATRRSSLSHSWEIVEHDKDDCLVRDVLLTS